MRRIQVRVKRRGRANQQGAAAVELAIILPLLMRLLFGIIEFGFVFNRWSTVTHSAREGVRQLALGYPAAEAEAMAEAAAPDIMSEVDCTASANLPLNEVTMVCDTSYDLALYVFDASVPLSSTATMRKE